MVGKKKYFFTIMFYVLQQFGEKIVFPNCELKRKNIFEASRVEIVERQKVKKGVEKKANGKWQLVEQRLTSLTTLTMLDVGTVRLVLG